MKVHKSLALQRALLLAAALVSIPAPQVAMAAVLNLPANPLFVSNDVAPNIMFMIDSSGSMTNVVADLPFTEATTYLATCPTNNIVPAGTSLQMRIQTGTGSGGPKIFYSGTYYDWGTGAGQRCFQTKSDYIGALNGDAEATSNVTATSGGITYYVPQFLPASYSGNYLNWYFNPSSVSGVTWNVRQRTKPLPILVEPTGFVLSRIRVARSAGQTLVLGLDQRLRVGLSIYNGNDGGLMRVNVDQLSATQRTALTTGTSGIANIAPGGNTPLAETLSTIGRYFATGYTGALTMTPKDPPRTVTPTVAQALPQNLAGASSTAPVVLSCQQNFAVMLTDGRATQDNTPSYLAIGASPNNVMADYDGDCYKRNPACVGDDKKPNQTYEGGGGSDYLDDVAQALYETDLRPDFKVESDGKQFKNNVITHMIGFADSDVQDDPLLLRTATQGGGKFFAAANADALVAAFNDIVTDILERSASFSSASVNSTSLNVGSRLYQAGFNASNWLGELRSFPISAGKGIGSCPLQEAGDLCPFSWSAASVLDSTLPNNRQIITINRATRAGIPFRWASLPAAQQTLLNQNPNVLPTATSDAKGSLRLDYVRGDRTQEGAGKFRSRGGRLGDIVNSDPFFVGPPNSGLPFSGYSTFKSTYANRTGMVYVGGNDGMLHGFRASDGQELLAYIPGMLFGRAADPKLARLTALPYTHIYGVDGSPTIADVQIGSTWATYLIGTMRYGAQGLFALDVTNPANFSEANAASIAKWEFTDADDADLGNTFSQPSIVKMKNGKWAAIIGNGYNNREADGSVSSTGRAALFVIYLDGPGADGVWDLGTDYLKFYVGTAPTAIETDNSLASPTVVDINDDRVADYIYAGDLYGNMWQFNVNCDPTKAGCTWAVGYSGSPLFVALSNTGVRQPITAPASVGFNLLTADPDDLTIFFGTGRYVAVGDNTQAGQQNQTFYGIFADPILTAKPFAETTTSPNPTKANLLRQVVLQEPTVNNKVLRVTSQNPILTTHKGWYIDLYNTATAGLDPSVASGLNRGERQISKPVVREGRVVFSTLIPSEDPCSFGGTSFLMEIDAKSGGRPVKPTLDVTSDFAVDDKDYITVNIGGVATKVAASGLALQGSTGTVAVVAGGTADYLYGGYDPDKQSALANTSANSGRLGRLSWREIVQ